MRSSSSDSAARDRQRPLKPRARRAVGLVGIAAVLALAAASCGGGGGGGQSDSVTVAVASAETGAAPDADFAASRPGVGIAAAGGSPMTSASCPADEGESEPGSGVVTIALVSPDVVNMDVIGLGDLVFDTPGHIGQAYVNKVNSLGGINGNCFDFRYFQYGFADPNYWFWRICTMLSQSEPLVLLGLGLPDPIVQCGTIADQIPTLGIYSQFPEAVFESAGGRLFADHGAVEFLVANSMDAAFTAGNLTASDRLGLLYSQQPVAEADGEAGEQAEDQPNPVLAVAEAEAARLGVPITSAVGVPAALEGTLMLIYLQNFAEAGGDIFDADEQRFEQTVGAFPENLAELLRLRRQVFLATVEQFKAANVTAVVAAGDWNSVRSLMIAAELVDWAPKWIINDAHYNMLVLLDSPQEQGSNLVQVSARRAADDPLEGLDRGCLSLRNAEVAAEPFSHRFHTDAWSLLTSTCDFFDVVFGAIARVDGELTREAFLAELTDTTYETSYGSLVKFAPGDPIGYDRFRLLSADYDCVLNTWGCMRPVSDWLPALAMPAIGGEAG